MDSKEIRELIDVISKSTVSKFEMEREGLKIKVVKEAPVASASTVAATVALAPAAQTAAPAVAAAPVEAAAPAPVDDGGIDLASPIVGTFYRSPGPEVAPFVEVGAKVTKGQVLCIIEAMKVMNEIEAEISAEILEVRVADGQPVEYGETIFRMRPL